MKFTVQSSLKHLGLITGPWNTSLCPSPHHITKSLFTTVLCSCLSNTKLQGILKGETHNLKRHRKYRIRHGRDMRIILESWKIYDWYAESAGDLHVGGSLRCALRSTCKEQRGAGPDREESSVTWQHAEELKLSPLRVVRNRDSHLP